MYVYIQVTLENIHLIHLYADFFSINILKNFWRFLTFKKLAEPCSLEIEKKNFKVYHECIKCADTNLSLNRQKVGDI